MLAPETLATKAGDALTVAGAPGAVLLSIVTARADLAAVRLTPNEALQAAGELERHALHALREERQRAAAGSPLSPLSVLFAHQRPWRRSV